MNVKSIVTTCCPPFLRPALTRIENSPIGYRLAKGVFWSMAGSLISRSLMLCAMVLVARILGKTVYGELGMIQSTVNMFGTFAGFGLGITATKHIAEFRERDPKRAGRIIALAWVVAAVTGGLMALGLLVFAPWLAEHTINAPHLAGPMRIGALILFISALNGVQTGVLSGFEAFKTIAQVNLLVGLISFPILLVGAYVGGLNGSIWALAASMAVNWAVNHLAIRKQARHYGISLALQDFGRELPILWRFSLPAVAAGAMVSPVNWICEALLVNQEGGYGEMGIYSAANQWFNVLLFLPSMLGSVVLPVLSEQLGRNNTAQSLKTLVLAIKANLILVAPIVVLGSLASPYIMKLYGESFSGGWPTLAVVLATSALLAVQMPVGQAIAASGRLWMGMLMNVGWAICFLGLSWLLMGHGAFGIASARASAYCVHAIWTFGFALKLLRGA